MLAIWTTLSPALHKDEKQGVFFSHADVIIAAIPADGSSDPVLFSPLFSSQEATMETATLTCSLLGGGFDLMLSVKMNKMWSDSSLSSLIVGRGREVKAASCLSAAASHWFPGRRRVTGSLLTSCSKWEADTGVDLHSCSVPLSQRKIWKPFLRANGKCSCLSANRKPC